MICQNCNNKNCDLIDKLLYIFTKAGLKLFMAGCVECKDYKPKGGRV